MRVPFTLTSSLLLVCSPLHKAESTTTVPRSSSRQVEAAASLSGHTPGMGSQLRTLLHAALAAAGHQPCDAVRRRQTPRVPAHSRAAAQAAKGYSRPATNTQLQLHQTAPEIKAIADAAAAISGGAAPGSGAGSTGPAIADETRKVAAGVK